MKPPTYTAALPATIGFSLLLALAPTPHAFAGAQININIGPPPIVVAAPPAVVLIPGSEIYFVPHPEIDVFFYGGYWWSPRGAAWYRAGAYNGPWAVVEHRFVPHAVIGVPRNYRTAYNKEPPIPYGQWKKQHAHEFNEHSDEHNEKSHGQGHGHK